MTNREFFVAIAAGEINDEIMQHAAESIVKMDVALEKRKAAPKKVSEETLAKRNAILSAVTEEPMTASQIGALCGYSRNVVSGVLKAYVANGTVIKGTAKVLGEDGKSKAATVYSIS